jgi:hypothetical protein
VINGTPLNDSHAGGRNVYIARHDKKDKQNGSKNAEDHRGMQRRGQEGTKAVGNNPFRDKS